MNLEQTCRRILIVDDNPAIHEDFRKILCGEAPANDPLDAFLSQVFGAVEPKTVSTAFDLDSAFQGREALDKVERSVQAGQPYAMAFVDVRMPPGWDGVETITRLWAVDPSIQIVICTAYSDYSWHEIVEQLGNTDLFVILKKPFDNIEVLQLAHALTRKWLVTAQAACRMEDLERMVAERTAALTAANEDLHREIAERAKAQELLRQAQKMEAVGHLAAGVAHDFNNILTVIQGHASLQVAKRGLAPNVESAFRAISDASARGAGLTHQLLAFSRKQVLQPRVVALEQVTSSISAMLRRLLSDQIELILSPADFLPRLRADVCSLEQVILNLALNARDAMPEGGRLTITTGGAIFADDPAAAHAEGRAGRFAVLTVTDTGTGMDAHTASQIFEPFFTTKEFGKGTGMGLATVYGIVKQHEGWITVTSAPGAGTTFNVFLPATEEEVLHEQVLCIPAQVEGLGATVLLVEDDETVRELAREVLMHHGFTVIEACDGHRALEAWKTDGHRIDLLLTDMAMPGGLSGKDVATLIRAKQPALKVIFSSGYSAELIDEDFEGSHYLPKPYLSATLAETVNRVIRQTLVPSRVGI